MGSLDTKPKRKYKRISKPEEPVSEPVKPKKTFKSLSEGLADVGLKFKKLGPEWRFGDGSTLVEDITPEKEDINKIAEYMKRKAGGSITVTVASILKGAK